MKHIVIATHSSIIEDGAALNLRRYFTTYKQDIHIWYITHPLLHLKQDYDSVSAYTVYDNGKPVQSARGRLWKLPSPLLFAKDVIYTFFWCLRSPDRIDVFFGVDNLMAFAGLLLKSVGKVHRVVYYGVDYFPVRFANVLMNRIYHGIDTVCVRFADETWNVSQEMQRARARNGMRGKAYVRQYTVPIGIWPRRLPAYRIRDRFRLFYIGLIDDVMGLDLVIRSMPGLKKKYAAIRFDIVGYGPAIPKLKVLVRTLGLRPIVAFHGLLAGGKKRASLFAHAGIGVAPFNTTILDARVKNADPMKLKEYMSYGIPVIVTDAISNAFKIQRSGGGIVIPYREDAFLRAVTILVGNTSHYADFRHKALHYALTFDWKIIYKKHLLRLGIS